MNTVKYVVTTIRPWNLKTYQNVIWHFPGSWHLITRVNREIPEMQQSEGLRSFLSRLFMGGKAYEAS